MKTPNVATLARSQTTGARLRRVRLNADLLPERVLEHLEEGVVYRKGWVGTVIDGKSGYNRKGQSAVLFDDYQWPVWIDPGYLDPA